MSKQGDVQNKDEYRKFLSRKISENSIDEYIKYLGLTAYHLSITIKPETLNSKSHVKKYSVALSERGFSPATVNNYQTAMNKYVEMLQTLSTQQLSEEEWENKQQRLIREGKSYSVLQTRYERSKKNRDACIGHFGTICQVCDFDFFTTYGDIGKDFIHVHHKNPLKNYDGEQEVDPIKDLVPLCPNCHAMVHKKDPPYTVKELKKIIECN